MLRNAAGFALDDIGAAKRVQQAGLAVVDMAHDGDDRRARLERFFRIDIFVGRNIDVRFGHLLDGMTELFDEQFRRILVDRLVDGNHHVEVEEFLDEIGPLLTHTLGQFADRDRLWDDNVAYLLFARLARATALHPAFLFTGTLQCGEAARTAAFILVESLLDGQLARTALVRRFGLRTAGGLLFLLLALGLLDLGSRDRGEPARSRRRRCRRGFLCRCFFGSRSGYFGLLLGLLCLFNLLRLFGGLLGRFFLGLAVFFRPLLLVFYCLPGLLFLAFARFFGLAQPVFLGFALKPGDAFLRRLVRRGRLLLDLGLCSRRGRRRSRRGLGRRRRRWRRGRRLAGLNKLAAALHLDRHLVGAAVAEGLLDLTRLRALQGKRFAGWFLVVVAHSCSFLFVSIVQFVAGAR